MYICIKNNSYKNCFFIFNFYITLTAKLDGNPLTKKIIFFVDNKTTFSFHLLNKINDFATTKYDTAIFYLFYLNLYSLPYENGIDKAQFSW